MRKFSSYGPIINASNYYAPREELIEKTYINLIGENPAEGGHYFTVWAPRQTGKTWLMQQIYFRLLKDERFDTLAVNLERMKDENNVGKILEIIADKIGEGLGKKFPKIYTQNEFQEIFKKGVLNKPPYDETVIQFFETGEKTVFTFDDKNLNYLYMNGIIAEEKVGPKEYYVKFSSPFVQKRIFNFFSRRFFSYLGQLIHPLDAMEDAMDEENLYLPNIIKRYQAYLSKNRGVFFKDVPRRKTDLKIYEAIYHFNIFRYLYDLLKARGVEVIPHFPTGNGKIDLILKYREKIHALELKSFKDMYAYEKGIEQAAEYGRQMGLTEVAFLVFVELTEAEAKQLEKEVVKNGVKVTVLPVAIL